MPDQPRGAGASARDVYRRRSAIDADRRRRRDEVVRCAHPLVGGMLLAFADNREPQSTKAWKTGAEGEEAIGRRLDTWAATTGNAVLHDRRIPGGRANIDHIVVAPSGVWVIDAKHYADKRVEHVDAGTWLRDDWRLRVGGRDAAKLVDGVLRQTAVVERVLRRATDGPPVTHAMLCFVGAQWAAFARPFVHGGVHVSWPRAAIRLIDVAGTAPSTHTEMVAHVLAKALVPA